MVQGVEMACALKGREGEKKKNRNRTVLLYSNKFTELVLSEEVVCSRSCELMTKIGAETKTER